jgi:hypothetical protein
MKMKRMRGSDDCAAKHFAGARMKLDRVVQLCHLSPALSPRGPAWDAWHSAQAPSRQARFCAPHTAQRAVRWQNRTPVLR